MTKTVGSDRRAGPRQTSFLEGGGELGRLMRSHDWASTPLGPADQWPQSLKSAVSILLPSKAQIVLFWGPDFITLYNDAYRPVFGAKHPRALGQPAREAWSEIWETGLRELFEGVVNTGEAFWAKDRLFILERYGYPEETYFDVSYDPVRDESGDVGGLFCIVSEVSDSVIGERRLHTLRDLASRQSVARTPDEACSLCLQSLHGNPKDIPFALLYLSNGAGAPPSLVCGAPEAAHLGDPGNWPWAEVMETGEMQVVLLPTRIPSAAWDHPISQAVVLPLAGSRPGEPPGLVVCGLNPFQPLDDDYRGFLELMARGLATGIASARAYEAERARAESLAELDRVKTAFFSNVSHEFRTPLTLMLGPLEDTLANSAALSEADRERLTAVHRNAVRLHRLVNALLDFSRLESGRLQGVYRPTDLSSLTTDLASVFRAAVERAGLSYVVDCPPVGEPVYVDQEMWEKIVFNLLSNALKFTFSGRIEVRLTRSQHEVTLSVGDTGTGIPESEIPHLFTRFHQVKGSRGRSFEGSGIGLALVQELARLHGGSVSVESEVGLGSRFVVSIPLGSAHLAPHQVVAAPAEPQAYRSGAYDDAVAGWLPGAESSGLLAADSEPGTRSRILIADDNADMRSYLGRMLGDLYDVEAVGDGAAALRAARVYPPDLVLTDVMMPELDGFGLLRELRADETLRSVPVVMLSARAGEEATVEGVEAGADDYLIKPFAARELLARVATRLELRRLQQAAERDRADLADLFAQTPVPIAVLRGPELVFEQANPAFAEVTGRRDLIGRRVLEALPELENQAFDHRLREVLRTGLPYVGREELLRLQRGGRVEDTYWNFVYSPLRETDGTVTRVIAICSEVTAQVRVREEIARSEARYRTIFNSAGVSIWEEDFSRVKALLDELRDAGVENVRQYLTEHPEVVRQAIGLVRVVAVNEPTLAMYGARDQSELLGSLSKIFLPETEPVFLEEMVAIAEGRPGYQSEAVAATIQGKRLDALISVSFNPDDPNYESVLVTVTDISGRKVAEQALLELNQHRLALIGRLREADRHKDEFLATLAHELRNPLAPLRNSLHLLRLSEESGSPVPARVREMMERQVNHMVRLVDDLLEMSRITRGTLELRREPVEVTTVVRNALETSGPLIQNAGHVLEVSFPDEPLWVDGDPVRLAQVLANLLNNSAKYTDPGGRISIRVRREQGNVAISVRDNGRGISSETLPHVFDMFRRGSQQSERDEGGLGIGLALALRLVEMHDGRIECFSAGPGCGSDFTVWLPLRDRPAPRKSVEVPTVNTVSRRRIMVVDDNRDAAESLGLLLEVLGGQVRLAHDGAGAVEVFSDFAPDVVLLDIGLPEIDGYEVARRLRAASRGRPVMLVALTGWGQDADRRRAREAGFDHHLTKPADMGELHKLLASLK